MGVKASLAKIGEKAPLFVLEDKDGIKHALEDLLGELVVLYFYPKDSTPGCALEAQEFSELLPRLKELNAKIFGISGGDQKSKRRFCEKFSLSVPLLSDPNFAISKKYGAYGKKQFMGRTFLGIHRCTFIIDKLGVIKKTFEKVKAQGHAQEVLDYLTKTAATTVLGE